MKVKYIFFILVVYKDQNASNLTIYVYILQDRFLLLGCNLQEYFDFFLQLSLLIYLFIVSINIKQNKFITRQLILNNSINLDKELFARIWVTKIKKTLNQWKQKIITNPGLISAKSSTRYEYLCCSKARVCV